MTNEKEVHKNVHWADHSAQRVIDSFPDEKVYTVASGITPSGYIHIGNFREVITTEMVRRALNDKGKKTKFIYSWDSYDAFRKVPSDVPKEWEKYLRMPDGEVPNPFEKEGTYAKHFMNIFENEVSVFNFPVEFQDQFKIQSSGEYAKDIRNFMKNRKVIIDVLNKYREAPLADDWLPIDIYDDETRKDDNQILDYDEEYTLTYKNSSGKEKKVNFKEEPRVKLRWKADWPMRWNHYKVCFEPGGKDHSTPGSSFTVGAEMIKVICDRLPPVYTMYDFVKVKGQGGKISSSKGGALRVGDVLEVYTPEMILYLFAGSRPNSELDISFDLDVIKIYEDFDRLERLYYGLEEEKNPKKLATLKRVYELSMINGVKVSKSMPFQPSFRDLANVSQANDFDFDKVKENYNSEIKSDFDKTRLKQRFDCVKNWLENHAPEEMIFSIKKSIDAQLNETEKKIVSEVVSSLEQAQDAKQLFGEFKRISIEFDMKIPDFFKLMYNIIIGKNKGPKLGGLMIENKQKILSLLKSI